MPNNSYIEEEVLEIGIRETLVFYGYLSKNKVYTTMQQYTEFYELNYSFWDTAYDRAQNGEFIVHVDNAT